VKKEISVVVILVGVVIKLIKKTKLKEREIGQMTKGTITNVTATQNLVWTKVFPLIRKGNRKRAVTVTPPDILSTIESLVLMIRVTTGGRWLVDPMRMAENSIILVNGKEFIKRGSGPD